MLGREGEFYHLRFHVGEGLESWLLHAGRLPLPPYIRREPGTDDHERYQTVFAKEIGAVAAPTAGLHFDEPLLEALRARGVEFGHVTLTRAGRSSDARRRRARTSHAQRY